MFTINAEVRKEQGKGASRRLRAANKFPAIIYGGAAAPVAIELDHDKVWNMQDKAEFYSEVLTVVVDGKEEKVKVQAVQRHAFKPKLTHIDFVRAESPIASCMASAPGSQAPGRFVICAAKAPAPRARCR